MLDTIKMYVSIAFLVSLLFYASVSIIVYFRNKKLSKESLKDIDSQLGDKNV